MKVFCGVLKEKQAATTAKYQGLFLRRAQGRMTDIVGSLSVFEGTGSHTAGVINGEQLEAFGVSRKMYYIFLRVGRSNGLRR